MTQTDIRDKFLKGGKLAIERLLEKRNAETMPLSLYPKMVK
jgi:hypothetical protein